MLNYELRCFAVGSFKGELGYSNSELRHVEISQKSERRFDAPKFENSCKISAIVSLFMNLAQAAFQRCEAEHLNLSDFSTGAGPRHLPVDKELQKKHFSSNI